nr:hypothetical protein [Planctomyces sp. SH-PL14]
MLRGIAKFFASDPAVVIGVQHPEQGSPRSLRPRTPLAVARPVVGTTFPVTRPVRAPFAITRTVRATLTIARPFRSAIPVPRTIRAPFAIARTFGTTFSIPRSVRTAFAISHFPTGPPLAVARPVVRTAFAVATAVSPLGHHPFQPPQVDLVPSAAFHHLDEPLPHFSGEPIDFVLRQLAVAIPIELPEPRSVSAAPRASGRTPHPFPQAAQVLGGQFVLLEFIEAGLKPLLHELRSLRVLQLAAGELAVAVGIEAAEHLLGVGHPTPARTSRSPGSARRARDRPLFRIRCSLELLAGQDPVLIFVPGAEQPLEMPRLLFGDLALLELAVLVLVEAGEQLSRLIGAGGSGGKQKGGEAGHLPGKTCHVRPRSAVEGSGDVLRE